MTSIINNSNANSALVNTLESSNSMVNPNVYSTKEIYPTSATTWTRCEKSNGTSNAGSTMNFNLNKYGIIEQILFQYQKSTKLVTGGAISAGDVFDVIERVELLSASRVVSMLTSADLAAQFSDLEASQFEPIYRTCVKSRSAKTAHTYVLPLTFGFMQDINTQLNSSFLEPLSIRITFGVNINHFTTVAAGNATNTPDAGFIQKTFLNIRYKSYPEQATAQILASNYNAPELVQVSTRFYDENALTVNLTAAEATKSQTEPIVTAFDLRNTDCVESFYISLRQIVPAVATVGAEVAAHLGPYLQIQNITYTGSGQEIINLDQQQMEYASLTENGFSSAPMLDSLGADSYGLQRLFKIQTGLYENHGGGVLSNTQSLREINAPRISITWASVDNNASDYRLEVVENCTAIYSTSSAVGRLSLALSN